MLAGLKARGATSVFIRYLETLDGHPTADGVLAAIATTLAWGPLMHKRISRLTAESLPWWIRLFGALIGASVAAERHEPGRFCGIPESEILGQRSLTEVAYVALLGLAPQPANLFAFQTLVGLLLTNGPGAISAQGAKGAVSADGPETPERVQLNKALVGFLTAFRLYAWRQRLRGHRVPHQTVPRFRSCRSDEPESWPRSQRARPALRRRIRALQDDQEIGRESRHPEDSRRQSPGVQGQTGQPRSAGSIHP